MGRINICIASDNNYAQPSCVLISSVLCNAKDTDDIEIYMLCDNVTNENKEKIKEITGKRNNCKIYFINPDNNNFTQYLTLKTHNYLSISSYYRLNIHNILSKYDVEKIIYLDSDMVVNTSLEELYNTDLDGNFIGGVVDISPIRMNKKTKLPLLNKYINSGMLLIDVKKWRDNHIEQLFYKYIQEKKEEIFCGDQQIINVVLNGKIKILDPKWNVQTSNFMNRSSYIKRPNIIHYIGCSKPWIYASYNYFKDYWFKYLDMTPFALTKEEKNRYEKKGQIESIIRYIKHRPLIFLHPKFWLAFFCTYCFK